MMQRPVEATTRTPKLPEPRSWLAPLALFLLALAAFTANLGHPPRFDELYHVLGARGYLADGQPSIADGVYERVELFTISVALLFDWFGESLAVGRLPGMVSVAALVVALFLWLREVAGPLPAWLAAAAFLLSPFAVGVAQDIRFYGPHALLFWIGAVATYTGIDGSRRTWPVVKSWRRMSALAMAALAFLGALYLQEITLIGLGGVAIWAICQSPGQELVAWLRRRPSLGLLSVGLGVVVVAAASGLPVWSELARQYRWTPDWNASRQDQFWYYHQWLVLYYPTLWPLTPIAALVAIPRWPQPAFFCVTVFGVAFIAHSFAGQKALLYLFYAFPFLFALWGMAVARLLDPIARFVMARAHDTTGQLGVSAVPGAATVLAVGALSFGLLANAATIRTVALLAGFTMPPELPEARWATVAAALRDDIDRTSILVTTNELHALYFLGRHDLLISPSRLSQLPQHGEDAVEFSHDPRTGSPVISTVASVELVMDCLPDGLLVTEDARWRQPAHLGDDVAEAIVRRAERVPLAAGTGLRAYRWSGRHLAGEPGEGADCARLEALIR